MPSLGDWSADPGDRGSGGRIIAAFYLSRALAEMLHPELKEERAPLTTVKAKKRKLGE